MKKTPIILAFLLAWSSAYAGFGTQVIEGGAVPAAGEAGCTGPQGNNADPAATYLSASADRVFVTPVVLTCGGTPSSINLRTKYGNTNMVFALYDDDGTAGGPGTRLWYSGTPVATGNSSTVVTISDNTINYELSAGTYYIGAAFEASGRIYETAATGGDVRKAASTDAYAVPPESFGDPASTPANDVCIWLVFP